MPALPTILFFVNSRADSTDGRRVRQFRRRLRCSERSAILYREEHGKVGSIAALLTAALRLRPDLIYVELFAYSGLLGGLLAKLLLRIPLAVGNGDEVSSTHWKQRRFMRALFSGALERLLWRLADLWAVWSPYYHRWLLRRGVKNVVCVPGAVDLAELGPEDATGLRAELGLAGSLVVGVVGNLQYSARLDMVFGWDLIAALALVRDLPVRGLIVGDGPGLARLREMAKEHGVEDRVVMTGRLPHAELARYYSAMDVGLVTLSNDLDARFTWTAKLPEYLACNVFPVLTDVDRSRRIVARSGAALPFTGLKDAGYPARLAALLRRLVEEPRELERRRLGRATAQGLMSFEVATRHLQRGIDRVLVRG